MKKAKKENKLVKMILPVACLAIVGLLFMGVSAKAEISVMDRLLQIAGNVWGNRLPVPEAGEISFGAMPGNELFSDTFTVNGITTWYERHDGLFSATTTPCAFQSPAATSTLTHAMLYLDVSTTTISSVYFHKAASTSNNATTTQIGEVFTIADGGAGLSIVASTTWSASTNMADLIFTPNQWLNITMLPADEDLDGTPGTVSPTGKCQATFVELR